MFVYQSKDLSPCEVIQAPWAPNKAGFLPFLGFSLGTFQFFFYIFFRNDLNRNKTLDCTIPVMVCLRCCVVASDTPVLVQATY